MESLGPEDHDDLADSFDKGCVIGFWCGALVVAVIVALFGGFAT